MNDRDINENAENIAERVLWPASEAVLCAHNDDTAAVVGAILLLERFTELAVVEAFSELEVLLCAYLNRLYCKGPVIKSLNLQRCK